MATRDELYTALRNADAAGDTEGARKLAAYIQSMPADAPAEAPKMSDAERIGRGKPSAAVTAAQGPLFGFGDEIGGAITATIKGIPGLDKGAEGTTWRQRYEGYRDVLRGQEAGYKAENPLTATGLQVAASIPTMAVTGPVAAGVKGTGMAANALRAALTGGASGAISGAGNSRAETLGGVAEDAAIGGATGAALGGATVPAVAAVGAAVRPVASKLNGSAAANYAREKVAEAFSRDAQGSVFKRNSLLDEVPANPAGRASARLNRLGGEARVVDAGGQSAKSALDILATLPGDTKNAAELAIRARQAGRGSRMIGAADDALGAGGRRAAATVDDLIAKRSEEARPLYESLYKTGVFVNDELRGIIDAATKLGASGEAKKVAAAAQRDYTLTPETQWVGLRDLDYLKQGLDDIIEASKTAMGQPTKVTAAVQGLKTRLVSELDAKTNGAYKTARDAYAGKSAIIDAVNNGRKALTQDDATISSLTQNMGASELEGFRIGAFEALRAKLGVRSGQTSMIEMWREPAVQEKLRAIFGTERAYRQFAASVAGEGRLKGLESVGRGSQTAARNYAAGDLDVAAAADAGQAVSSAAGGNLLGAIPMMSRAWNRVSTPEPVRNEMGRILLSQGPQAQQEMRLLSEYIDRVNAARNQNALRTGSFVGANFSAPTANALSQR